MFKKNNTDKITGSEGLFIVFDGPADSGKSSIIKAVSVWLEAQNILTHKVAEPALGSIGKICREYANKPEHPYTLACLIAAGRYKNLVDEIIPYKSQGYVVLEHRYLASNYVYQIMHGVEREFIDGINTHITIPNLTFLVTSSSEQIKLRRSLDETTDIFQSTEHIEFEIYLFEEAAKLLQQKGHSIVIINNTSEISIAIKEVQYKLLPLIKEKLGISIKIE